MSARVTTTTFTQVEAVVRVSSPMNGTDDQGRRTLKFTEADAQSLMYALADALGFQVTKLAPAHDTMLPH